jgi:hypothetical protein
VSKCVFRTDLRQLPMGETLTGIEANDLCHLPAAHTVNECVQMLLTHDEICLGASEKRSVMQGARVVGYIRIVDAV